MYATLITAVMAAGAMAAPAKLSARQAAQNIDPTILNFALTVEHLENTFYREAIQKFSAADFAAAGYDATYYNNLKYISFDEQSHVASLSAALTAAGVTPVQPCTYKFPYTDVPSFITLSSVLEGVGTSAYLGAAPLVTDKGYLTVAGSILVTEALHTSYQRAAVKEVPFANPYGTPIDPMSAYTLAAQFIVSCPPGNPDLGFKAFPALTFEGVGVVKRAVDCPTPSATGAPAPAQSGWNAVYNNNGASSGSSGSSGNGANGNKPAPVLPTAGSIVKFSTTGAIPAGSYLVFVSGLDVISVPATANGNSATATIPKESSGQTYVYLTNGDAKGKLMDANVLAGPAIVEVAPAAPALNY